jgi:hypothetical protein
MPDKSLCTGYLHFAQTPLPTGIKNGYLVHAIQYVAHFLSKDIQGWSTHLAQNFDAYRFSFSVFDFFIEMFFLNIRHISRS